MNASIDSPRHVLTLHGMDDPRWHRLLDLSECMAGPLGRVHHLRGKRVAMVFFNASLRTRTALEIACFDLGAHAINLNVGGGLWSLEHRDDVVMDGPHAEHVREGFGVLGRMADAVGVRVFASLRDAEDDERDPTLGAIAQASPVPVVNLESAMAHPHQGLADALTVRRTFPGERVKVALTWAPHIKPLPLAVAQSALIAFAREGHEVVLAHPEGYDLSRKALSHARALADRAGGSVSVIHQQGAALRGARVVYAKSWGSSNHYGDVEAATHSLGAHRSWKIGSSQMGLTDDAIFMHCLPVRRGVVVDADVLQSAASVVLAQAEARLHVQKATLMDVMGVDVSGLRDAPSATEAPNS